MARCFLVRDSLEVWQLDAWRCGCGIGFVWLRLVRVRLRCGFVWLPVLASGNCLWCGNWKYGGADSAVAVWGW